MSIYDKHFEMKTTLNSIGSYEDTIKDYFESLQSLGI
jgi:hypothetical protein